MYPVVIILTLKYHNVATLTQPLSLNDGGMKINLAGVSGANWTIGLCRSNPLFVEGADMVPYYQPSQSVATRAFDFYDFKILCRTICWDRDSVY